MMLDNRYALLFIRGERPILARNTLEKYAGLENPTWEATSATVAPPSSSRARLRPMR